MLIEQKDICSKQIESLTSTFDSLFLVFSGRIFNAVLVPIFRAPARCLRAFVAQSESA